MRKLLAILSSIGLTATASSAVVSCSNLFANDVSTSIQISKTSPDKNMCKSVIDALNSKTKFEKNNNELAPDIFDPAGMEKYGEVSSGDLLVGIFYNGETYQLGTPTKMFDTSKDSQSITVQLIQAEDLTTFLNNNQIMTSDSENWRYVAPDGLPAKSVHWNLSVLNKITDQIHTLSKDKQKDLFNKGTTKCTINITYK